ncbi:MAG: hypothetical protein K1X65_08425 [Caldilineales bacterium]|nr:hypothetical protein [Caldilineales bacterium]MCW5857412.1 hypothetical protein [Caldilineales bacterium]
MSYDIAAKVLIDRCRSEILRRFLDIPVTESTLLEEAPQETTTLRRSDFPLLVTEEGGRRRLVIIEVQSQWEGDLPLRLLEYRCRHMLRHRVHEATSCILLLTPSALAIDHFADNEVAFGYHLIRVYELDAAEILSEGALCLLPLVPLMRGGIELTDSADRRIYGSSLPPAEKADMLTGMAILSGLVSRDLAATLIAKRRDLMIESYAYELIKQEGIQEGMDEGLTRGLKAGRREGLEQGLERGLERGRGTGLREGLLDSISFGLGLRFGTPGDAMLPEISRLPDTEQLRAVAHALWTVETLEELRAVYQPN